MSDLEPKNCLRCHETMDLPDDVHESTDYCHDCVYLVLDEMKSRAEKAEAERDIASATIADLVAVAEGIAFLNDAQTAIDVGVNYFGAQLLIESIERREGLVFRLVIRGKKRTFLVHVEEVNAFNERRVKAVAMLAALKGGA